jgi:hypothetical protein
MNLDVLLRVLVIFYLDIVCFGNVIDDSFYHHEKVINCGEANIDLRRANNNTFLKYPWMAEMYYYNKTFLHCAGAIITASHIITSGEE